MTKLSKKWKNNKILKKIFNWKLLAIRKLTLKVLKKMLKFVRYFIEPKEGQTIGHYVLPKNKQNPI